ncbi:MAG: hypothetical protein HC899_05510 [Leptolyngbyaceae cyanobacterium SM1_4_3]|nr:hypothetical protein [Leptolyngbyaceae cyanobacterium SM1_4_3]NJN89870.1 hypothetical protein [Leptolyngbyaceae cyanobacterium SL_5_14]
MDQEIEFQNSPNSGQVGQAGRDLIQVGRDYIQYIYNNSRNGHWGKVAFALIPLFLFLYGAREVGIKVVETFTSKSPEELVPNPLPTRSPIDTEPERAADSQTSEFQFPQNSCGDQSTNSDTTWYPVFINGRSLDEIRQEFCRDAIPATRQTGERSVQVASFISLDKAQRFAVIVGGEVGEPRQPKPTVSPQASSSPESEPPATVTSPPNSDPIEDDASKGAEEEARLAVEQEDTRRADERERRRNSTCILTITNSLVPLRSEPENFSQELITVRPGEYIPIDYRVTSFGGLRNDGWFMIEAEGRRGWIRDDTWTIDSKTRLCQ